MKKTIYLLPALFLIFLIGCTPTEKKADVPPSPKVPRQAAPAPTPQADPATADKDKN